VVNSFAWQMTEKRDERHAPGGVKSRALFQGPGALGKKKWTMGTLNRGSKLRGKGWKEGKEITYVIRRKRELEKHKSRKAEGKSERKNKLYVRPCVQGLSRGE